MTVGLYQPFGYFRKRHHLKMHQQFDYLYPCLAFKDAQLTITTCLQRPHSRKRLLLRFEDKVIHKDAQDTLSKALDSRRGDFSHETPFRLSAVSPKYRLLQCKGSRKLEKEKR